MPVAPRYLAGPGFDTDYALNVLIEKRSWPHHTDPDLGNVFIHSPCGRVDVAFMGDYLSPWQIRVSREPMEEPAWFAAWSGAAPPEIVGAFLETLADTLENLPDQLTSSRSPYLVKEATRPLDQAGWNKHIGDTTTTLTPYGDHAELAGLSIQRRPEPWQDEEFEPYAETITMWGGPKKSHAHWKAEFTTGTPLHLIAAATRSLITPAPVERNREDLDPAVLPYLNSSAPPSSRAAAARAASPAAAGVATAVVAAPPAAVHRETTAASHSPKR